MWIDLVKSYPPHGAQVLVARVDAAAAARCSGSSSSPDRVGQSVNVDVARAAAVAALAAAAAEVFRGGVDDALARRGEPTHARATR